MRKILVYFLKNSNVILFFYNAYYRLKNRKAFYAENERRRRLSIFDYKSLANPIPYYPSEKMRDSNYYGYAQALKIYAGVPYINAALEHGLYLGDRITTAEGFRTTRSVIAMSENRVESFKIHGLKKPIIAIGPYIHYATPLLKDDAFKQLKEQLGRILLVMPVHAAKGASVKYNPSILLDFIEKVRPDFDSFLTCIHFRDILNNPDCVKPYEEAGCKIVCAGNEYDYNFVRRLKSIIMLSDYVVSNSHGTNTGFCTYLGKPQTIIYDQDLIKTHNSYTAGVKKIRDEQVHEIESAFVNYSNVITEEQKMVVDKYWGISCIKAPDELKEALKNLK